MHNRARHKKFLQRVDATGDRGYRLQSRHPHQPVSQFEDTRHYSSWEVNVETAHQRPRWGSWILIGIGFAFAWLAMSFILGLGTSEARADDSGGLLGGLTSTVDNTVRVATNTTTAVTTPVVQAVVKTTAAVPVVGPTVTQVVTTTTNAVASATQPIASSTSGLVTQTTAPVVKAVDSTVTALLDTATAATAPLPVVGSVVGAVGSVVDSVDLTGTLGAVTGVVDDTVGAVTGTATDVLAAPGSTPTVPGTPGVPVVPGLVDQGAAPAGVEPTTAGESIALDALTATLRQAAAAVHAAASVVLTLSPADGALRLAGDTSPVLGAATPGGTSAGSSGAGPGGATALLAFGLFFAHRAWVRRRVSSDQQAPPVPVYDTDISPD